MIPGQIDGIGRYSIEILKIMVAQNPQVKFTFIFDRPFSGEFIFGENVRGIYTSPPTRHSILMIMYFEWSLPRLLKKIKADILFSPDGWVSLRCKIPQIPVIHDLNFEHFPQFIPLQWRWYYRFFFPRFAKKAKHIITVSQFSAQDICKTYGISENKISVAPNAVFHNHQKVDVSKVPNLAYFLFVSTLHPRKNIVNIIKAYNIFRTKNSEKRLLVFAGKKMWWTSEMENEFQNSPFREDIIFTGRVSDEQLNGLYQNAHALLYPSLFEGFGLPIIEAFKWKIPVITANNSSLPEVGGDAAVYCDANSPQSIADAMIKVENESTRQLLIANTQAQIEKFNWNHSAKTVMEVINKI